MRFIFLLVAVFVSAHSFSQITISENDMPSNNSIYFLDNALPDLTIDLTQTGANHTWDYSQLSFLNAVADTFISSNDLPLVYFFFFLSSNLAEKNALSLSLDQLTLSDVFTVYKKSSSQFQIDGYAGTLDGIPLPIVYSSTDVLYRFPLNYANSDSSDALVNFSIPGFVYFEQSRHRVNEVDGWGTLNSPAGSFDVLRVKSTISDVDSFYLDTLGSGYSLNLKSYEYKWLAIGKGIPVLQINAEDVLGAPVISQIIYQDTVLQSGIAEAEIKSQIKVFPIPADKFIGISLSENFQSQYFIYNEEGELVKSGSGSAFLYLNVSDLYDGLYFINVSQNGHRYSSSFIVAR